MKIDEFKELFDKGKKRFHTIGGKDWGILMGLDLEGRLFAFMNGEILNKVNPEAVLKETTGEAYLNPGGDGLWPAPEGTCVGYEYPSGSWRVPPGLTGAKYIVTEEKENYAKISAEIDLINNLGTGVPTIFERAATVLMENGNLKVNVVESIKYIGTKEFNQDDCLLAPWSLCQFDSGEDCEVVFPDAGESAVWDLYDSSAKERYCENGFCHTKTNGSMRYQIAIGKDVPWIEFRNPTKKMRVKRSSKQLPEGQEYIDIVDAPPTEKPSKMGVKLSVYSDPSLFMEIEAAGGAPQNLSPGNVMSVEIDTVYSIEQ
jgi:hypothetical protein